MESIVVKRPEIGGMTEVDTDELIGNIMERPDELNRRDGTMVSQSSAEGTTMRPVGAPVDLAVRRRQA